MSELTLIIFRIAFLIALWVFVFFVVYAVRSDLFGERVKKLVMPKSAKVASDPRAQGVFLSSTPAPDEPVHSLTPPASAPEGALKLVITAGPKQGESIFLTSRPLSIGRSSDSAIVIRDDYTSTHHARLEFKTGTWVLADLGSTNGTFLNGKKLTEPAVVPLNTPFTIGSTTFEIRG